MAYAKLGSATLGTTQLGWNVDLTGYAASYSYSYQSGVLAIGAEPVGQYGVLTQNEYAATLVIGQEPIAAAQNVSLAGQVAILTIGNDLPNGGKDSLSVIYKAGTLVIGQEPAGETQSLSFTPSAGTIHAGWEKTGDYSTYTQSGYAAAVTIGQRPISVTGSLTATGYAAQLTHGNDLPNGGRYSMQWHYLQGDVVPKMRIFTVIESTTSDTSLADLPDNEQTVTFTNVTSTNSQTVSMS